MSHSRLYSEKEHRELHGRLRPLPLRAMNRATLSSSARTIQIGEDARSCKVIELRGDLPDEREIVLPEVHGRGFGEVPLE